MIKFSIIIPFYNSKDYLEKAIRSVVEQNYASWELILVNDGSQDESEIIALRYAARDNRIKVFKKNNGGYATAINMGLDSLSTDSDYFMCLGSDDQLIDNGLFELNMKIENNKPDMVCFGTLKKFESGKYENDALSCVKNDYYLFDTNLCDFYNNFPIIPRTIFVRDTSRLYKTKLLGNLRYFGKTGIDSDGIFSIMFSLKCKSFSHLNNVCYLWNVRDNSVSGGGYNFLKRIDAISSWTSFFRSINKRTELKYYLQNHFLRFVKFTCDVILVSKSLFTLNKEAILNACMEIKRTIYYFNYRISRRSRFIISMPKLSNFLYNLKRDKNEKRKRT